jgi:hypothetical protein
MHDNETTLVVASKVSTAKTSYSAIQTSFESANTYKSVKANNRQFIGNNI